MTKLILILAAAFPLMGSTIVTNLDSAPGLENDRNGVGTVAVSVHPDWEPNHPPSLSVPGESASAVWVSYALTGYDDPVYESATGAVVTVYQPFQVSFGQVGTLVLEVWVDNRVRVVLDGEELADNNPNFLTASFQPEQVGLYREAGIVAGGHILEFRYWQEVGVPNTHDNPFGLLYTGTVTGKDRRGSDGTPLPGETPEPMTVLFVGCGLFGVGLVVRWKGRRG